MDISEYSAMNTTQSYATVLAISSGRLTGLEIASYVADKAAMQSGAWKRLTPL
jgi:hypothetical protein